MKQANGDRPEAVVEKQRTHSEDGVDLTLIRWMLSLTPLERLRELQRSATALRKLRDASAHLR